MNLAQASLIILIVLVALGFSVSTTLVHLLTEVWWFDAVGFTQVFWTRLTWQILIWVVTLVVYLLFLWGNFLLARRKACQPNFRLVINTSWGIDSRKAVNYVMLFLISLVALIAATASIYSWETILKYLHPSQFGSSDPLFEQDIGFYVFRLPLYESICNWFWGLLISAAIISILTYSFNGALAGTRSTKTGMRISKSAKVHLSLLSAAIALLVAWGFWLARYHLLYSSTGVVFGAGYTDVHAKLLAYQLLSMLAVLVAVLLIISIGQPGFVLPLNGIGLFLVALVLVNNLYPWFIQQFIVNPNELVKEKPYIEHNIKFTQAAYHLDDVQRQNYAAEAQLERQSLANNQSTIDNVRLWDYRPLLSTYRQLQEIRLYYKFRDVDVDRYHLNGDYQQVMLSARELAFD